MSKQTSEFSPWAFKSPFFFETRAPIEEVLDSLAQLTQDDHTSQRNKMSILRLQDGYSFSYHIQRFSNRSWSTTAFAEGFVWEDSAGHVVVEGTAQIASMNLYGTIGFIIAPLTIANFLITGHFLSLFILLPLVIGAVLIFNYCRDRDHVVEHISAALGPQASLSDWDRAEKQKHAGTAEKVKLTRIVEKVKTSTIAEESVRTVSLCDSVWNDAISEYETWDRS